MTRAQSFAALTIQRLADRVALVTYQPKQSLDHQPAVPSDLMDDDASFNRLLAKCETIKVQAL